MKLRILQTAALAFLISLLVSCHQKPIVPQAWNYSAWLHRHDDLYSTMRRDYSLAPQTNNASVRRAMSDYQLRPHHLNTLLKQGQPYLYYVYQQTRAHHLPA